MTVPKRTTVQRDEFYLFTMPGDECPVWGETYLSDGTHMVAPTPYPDMRYALEAVAAFNPGATVDELDDAKELAEVRGWARTMPLEQIPDCTDPRCPVWHA